MKTRFSIILILLVSSTVSQVSGLSIDPFTTHNELNQVITTGDSFVFTMKSKDLERPLGLRLQYTNDDDVLKVKIRDPNGRLVLTSIDYNINEYQNSVSTEFTPQHEGLYQVEIINMGQSNLSLGGYYGEMLTWKEIDNIRQKYGYSEDPFVPIPIVLAFVLIGGGVGFTAGYFVFRWRLENEKT